MSDNFRVCALNSSVFCVSYLKRTCDHLGHDGRIGLRRLGAVRTECVRRRLRHLGGGAHALINAVHAVFEGGVRGESGGGGGGRVRLHVLRQGL